MRNVFSFTVPRADARGGVWRGKSERSGGPLSAGDAPPRTARQTQTRSKARLTAMLFERRCGDHRTYVRFAVLVRSSAALFHGAFGFL